MLHLNISKRERDALFDTLRSSHRIRTEAEILDSTEKPIGHFKDRYGTLKLISGSVDVDATQDVTRSLEMEFYDPAHRLPFNPETPKESGAFTGYFIHVRYCVLVPHFNLFPRPDRYPAPAMLPGTTGQRLHEGASWYEIPVFWGPITHLSSVAGHTTIEAQGKESLALDPHFAANSYRLSKGMHVDEAMMHVLQRLGERRFQMPNLPWKLRAHRAVMPQDEPWRVVALGHEDDAGEKVGALVDRVGKHPHFVHYDGRGYVRVSRLNKKHAHTFDGDWLTSEPEVDYEGLEYVNRVVVRGIKPKGKKHRCSASVQLPKENPLSPENLHRADQKPMLRTEFVDTDLDTDKKCRQRALHILEHHSKVALEASFECLPLPMLEENDLVRVRTENLHVEFPVKQFSIPLTAGAMSIGDTEKLASRPLRRHKRKHRAGAGAAGPGGGRRHS